MTQTAQHIDWAAKRKAWQLALADLADQIEAWCHARRWLVDRHAEQIDEKNLGSYSAPVLHIHPGAAAGAIVIEPVAGEIVGAEGRVDIYSIRTFAKLLLIRKLGEWILYTDAGVQWPQPWSEETFSSLLQTLTTP